MTVPSPRRMYGIATAALVLFSPASATSAIIPTYTNVDAPAQAVVDTAIGLWDDLLPDSFVFNINVERAFLGGTPALSSEFVEAGGLPVSARITFDDGTGAVPWFIDNTPDDDLEFHGGQTPFHAVANSNGAAAGALDLLTVIQHELAHALGFSIFYDAFAAHVEDTEDGNRAYVGSTVTARLTGAGGGTHILPEEHPFDLLNPELELGHRFSPSPLDLAVLHDAFGYALAPARPLEPVAVPEASAPLLTALSLLAAAARHLVRGRLRRRGDALGPVGGPALRPYTGRSLPASVVPVRPVARHASDHAEVAELADAPA